MTSAALDPGAFATGTLTRPFGRNPTPLVPASSSNGILGNSLSRPLASGNPSATDDNEAWRQKQAEIRELQEASQSLLRQASSNSQSTTPNRMVFGQPGGSLLASRGDEEVDGNQVSLLGSATDLLGSRQSGVQRLLSGGSGRGGRSLVATREDDELSHAGSSIVPLSLMSERDDPNSLPAPLLPAAGDELDGMSSFSSATGALVRRQASAGSTVTLPGAGGQLERSRSAQVLGAGQTKALTSNNSEFHALQQENASLLAEVMDLRRTVAERSKDMRASTDLRERLVKAERRVADLTDEVDRLRKAGEVAELLKGDGPLHKAVRSYIENDMASMRAERRTAEQALRAELQGWQDRAERLQVELQQATNAGAIKAAAAEKDGEARLQAQVSVLAAERQALQESVDQQQPKFEEERRKLKRESAKKLAELQQKSDETREEAEEAAAKAKEAERTMHSRISEARQERQRAEGKLKKQIQTLQTEVREAQGVNSETQDALAKAGAASEEIAEAQANLKHAQEESAVLHKRCVTERRKCDTLEARCAEVKAEHSEVRQQCEMAMLKDHSKAHEEAWGQLAVVERRHAEQTKDLQQAHAREVALVTKQVREKHQALELRAEADEITASERVEAEVKKCEAKSREIAVLENSMQELRSEVSVARQNSDSVTQQHEALITVLRREREVADTQFQQLVRQTEEKQRAIGLMESEVAYEEAMDLASPDNARSVSSGNWGSATAALPAGIVALGAAPAAAAATALTQLPITPRGEDDVSPAGASALAATQRPDEGVETMLRALALEREVHDTRRAAEELNRMLSSAGPLGNAIGISVGSPGAASFAGSMAGSAISGAGHDRPQLEEWQRQGRQLLEKLVAAYENSTRHSADEQLRMQAGRQREAALKEHTLNVEAKEEKRHERLMREAKKCSQERLIRHETEAEQTVTALRRELEAQMQESTERLRDEASEFLSVQQRCDVLCAAESVAIKCSVDAAEARTAADMREEIGEARRNSLAELADLRQKLDDEHNKHSSTLATVEADQQRRCTELESAAADERDEVRSELEELKRMVQKELMQARDEKSSFSRHEARMEARMDGVKQDRSETETELHETRWQLERELDVRSQELQGLEVTLQAASRKYNAANQELSADRCEQEAELERLIACHSEDRDMLAREVSLFQDEKLMLEEQLRLQEEEHQCRCLMMRQELDDAEIALQRSEAVSAERRSLLVEAQRNQRRTSPPAVSRRNSLGSGTAPATPQSQSRGSAEEAHPPPASAALAQSAEQPRPRSPEVPTPMQRRQSDQLRAMNAKVQSLEGLEAQAWHVVEGAEEEREKNAEQQAQMEKDCKVQLGQMREEKLRERQMKDRQIDKLKGRISELEKASEDRDRKQAAEAAQQRRQNDECSQQIEKLKGDGKQFRGTLKEAHAENARMERSVQELRQELHMSEDLLSSSHHQCQELVGERHVSQQSVGSWQTELRAMEAMRADDANTIAELQQLLEQDRRRLMSTTSEAQEARLSSERICKAFDDEIQQILPVLPDAEAQELAEQQGPGGVPTEGTVVGTFQALARFVSDLAQQNTSLRCMTSADRRHMPVPHKRDSHDTDREESKRQLAILQKEVVKLREENQEIKFESNRLQTQLARSGAVVDHARQHAAESQGRRSVSGERSGGDPGSPGAASGRGSLGGGSITTSVLSECRADAAMQRQSPHVSSASSHVDQRLKLRQLHAEKVKAETDVITYKQELSRKSSEFQGEIDRLQAALWETTHQHQNEQEVAQKRAQQMERKVRLLEGKLQERLETERQLSQEKVCVEEQLNLAAKQLEAMLAEEHKDGDLQRDLAGLSRQFEQLHGKHRAQLTKAAEQNQVMEQEREKRTQVEEQLREASAQYDLDLTQMSERHTEQMNQMQEQVQSLRKVVQAKEKELQESIAEQTTLTCETSNLRSLQQQQAFSSQELQEEVKRLHEELDQQHQLLREARDKGPGARDALQKLRQKEIELEDVQEALQAAEGNLKRAQAEVRANAEKADDFRRANDVLREEVRRTQDALRYAQEALDRGGGARNSSWSPPRERDTKDQRSSRAARPTSPGALVGLEPAMAQREWDRNYPDSSRSTRRYPDLACDRRESEDTMCVVRTVADSKPDRDAGLLSALEEIQDTLTSRERDLQERKATLSREASVSRGESTLGRSPPGEAVDPHGSIAELEREFPEVDRLWVDGRAEAIDFPPSNGRQHTPPQPQQRTAPIAADVQLKGPDGTAAAVRGYPDSPPPAGARGGADSRRSKAETEGDEVYPHSPGREDWIAGLDAQEAAAPSAEASGTGASASTAKGPEAQQGLPLVVRETFRRAEALCERQKYDEAVPCFQQVLSILDSGSQEVDGVQPVVVAEVWAHLGVAMQSLDRVREAIDSYKRAVALDVSLHVCFANLATLHAYLSEHEAATEYISKALTLDPNNATYNQIRRHLEDGPAQRGEGKSNADA